MDALIQSSGVGCAHASGSATAGAAHSRLTQHWRPRQTCSGSGGEQETPQGLPASDHAVLADAGEVAERLNPLLPCSNSPDISRASWHSHLTMSVPAVMPHQAQSRLVQQAAALAALKTTQSVQSVRQADAGCLGPEATPELPTPRIGDAQHPRLNAGIVDPQPGSSSATTAAGAAAAGGTLATLAGSRAAAVPTGKGSSSIGSMCSSRREFSLTGRQFSSINRVACVAGREYATQRSGKQRRRWSEERRWRAQKEASGHPQACLATSAPRVAATSGLPPGWPAPQQLTRPSSRSIGKQGQQEWDTLLLAPVADWPARRQQIPHRSHSVGKERQQEWSACQLAPLTGTAAPQLPVGASSPPALLSAAEAALQARLGCGLINVAAWVAASLASASGAGGQMGPDCLMAAATQQPPARVRVTVAAVLPACTPLPAVPVLLWHGLRGSRAPVVQALSCASNAGGQGSVALAPAGIASQALNCRPALKPEHVHMHGCSPCNIISALARRLGV